MAENSYSKRPLWQWIVLYIIIAAIAYGLIYFIFFHKNGSVPYQATNYNNQTTQNNMQTTGNTPTPDIQIDVLKQGTGPGAKTGDTVTVNYTGTLSDGTVFDSSLKPGRTPFPFTLGQNRVIQGWEKGVLGMQVGEEIKLTIPPNLGYGAEGVGYGGKFGCSGQPNCDPNKETYIIPPNATLTFTITLLKIN